MKTLVHTDKELIEATIKKCDICYVGLADTDGTPYVLPICITFSTDHDLVFQHPEVACSYRMRSKSVICWGEVHFEEDFDKKTEALDIIMKQYSDKEFRYSDPAVKNVKIWIVEMDEVTCKEFGAPHNKLKIGS